MAERSPHEILGVAPDASPDVLRKAFRAIARTCHPDVCGEDAAAAATFRAAREAYERLTGPARPTASATSAPAQRPARSRADREVLFRAMMRRASRGDGAGDPFEAMFSGADATPGRTGRADPTDPFADPFSDPVADAPPPAPRPEAPAGPADAIVDVSVSEAMLGAWIEVDAPAGPTRVVLPPSSSSGARLTLEHRGNPDPAGRRGPWTVEVRIVVPDELDEATRALVRELAARLPLARR